MIALKRVYDPIVRADGTRFLVERLWPRGLTKAKMHVDTSLKDVGPSAEVRKWFGHDPDKWGALRTRYRRSELDSRPDAWPPIVSAARRGPVTLVYSSRDTEHNNSPASSCRSRSGSRCSIGWRLSAACGAEQPVVLTMGFLPNAMWRDFHLLLDGACLNQ
jgi:uncharacterized protein YeaO (DUF488 family)